MPLIPRDAASSLVCSAVPAVHTIAQCTQSHSLLQTWCKWSPVCAQCSAKAKGSCASAFRCVSAFRPAHVCICLDNIAGVQVCVQRGTQYVCKELGACKRELLLAASSCCITTESQLQRLRAACPHKGGTVVVRQVASLSQGTANAPYEPRPYDDPAGAAGPHQTARWDHCG